MARLKGVKITYADILETPVLATVATSGDYNDLSNKPFIPSRLDDLIDMSVGAPGDKTTLVFHPEGGPYGEWWAEKISYNDLTNKPILSTVAATGSFNDLSNTQHIVQRDNNGNVGIGTASPTSALTVSGPISTTNSTAGVHLGVTGSISGIELANSGGGYIDFTSTSSDSLARIIFVPTGGANNLQIQCTAAINFYTGGFERGGIDTSGFWYLGQSGNRGTPLGANTYIDSASGAISKSVSSLKYKKDVRNYSKGLAEVLALRPVSFKSKYSSPYGDDFEFAGLIAEEVHAAGMTEFVQYAADSTPDGLSYGHMVALAFKAIQELNTKVDQLTEENRQLKERLTSGGL